MDFSNAVTGKTTGHKLLEAYQLYVKLDLHVVITKDEEFFFSRCKYPTDITKEV